MYVQSGNFSRERRDGFFSPEQSITPYCRTFSDNSVDAHFEGYSPTQFERCELEDKISSILAIAVIAIDNFLFVVMSSVRSIE